MAGGRPHSLATQLSVWSREDAGSRCGTTEEVDASDSNSVPVGDAARQGGTCERERQEVKNGRRRPNSSKDGPRQVPSLAPHGRVQRAFHRQSSFRFQA